MIEIHVLIENSTSNSSLKNKHGLSLAVDTQKNHLLLDVGPDGTFAANAEKMNYDLGKVETVILSHAHFDHSGGLDTFCKVNTSADVLLFDTTESKYFVKLFGIIPVPIGLKCSPETEERIVSLEKNHQVNDSVWFIRNTEDTHSQPELNARLYRKAENRLLRDDFEHEGILVIEDNTELVVFNSCSHNGVCNSVESVRKVFPEKSIRSYVGGFHFHNPAGNRNEDVRKMDELIEFVRTENIRLYTGHCTGDENYAYLQESLGDLVTRISTGDRLSV